MKATPEAVFKPARGELVKAVRSDAKAGHADGAGSFIVPEGGIIPRLPANTRQRK